MTWLRYGPRLTRRPKTDPHLWHEAFIRALVEVTAPRISLEVGVADGRTTRVLAMRSESVIAIDSDASVSRKVQSIRNVQILIGDSHELLSSLRKEYRESIDLAFIDGNHTADHAFGDFERVLPLMSRRGLVLLHDTYPSGPQFISESNEWCGTAYKVPGRIKSRYPDWELLTIPHHPGLTMVTRGGEPEWLSSAASSGVV